MMRVEVCVHVLLLSVLLCATVARADVVDAPPAECPPGAVGQSAHSGTWCEAETCATTDACRDGQTCRELSLCVETYERECGGMQDDTEPPCTFTVHEAIGQCGDDGSCARGTCETALRCAEPDRDGCLGCASVPARGGLAAGLGLLLLALARRSEGGPLELC